MLIVMLRAVIQVDGPIPTVTADISIFGSHFEHTVAADGSFKHPFEQVDPKVQTIHYEGSQTISKRMHRAASARKKHDVDSYSTSAIKKNIVDSFASYLWPDYGQASYQIADMTNVYNVIYLGEIYIGTPKQKLDVIYDTGSGHFLARSTYCTTCLETGTKFYYAHSSTWTKESPSSVKSVKYLDGTLLSGYFGTDNVCPTTASGSCANSFKFAAIYEASGL